MGAEGGIGRLTVGVGLCHAGALAAIEGVEILDERERIGIGVFRFDHKGGGAIGEGWDFRFLVFEVVPGSYLAAQFGVFGMNAHEEVVNARFAVAVASLEGAKAGKVMKIEIRPDGHGLVAPAIRVDRQVRARPIVDGSGDERDARLALATRILGEPWGRFAVDGCGRCRWRRWRWIGQSGVRDGMDSQADRSLDRRQAPHGWCFDDVDELELCGFDLGIGFFDWSRRRRGRAVVDGHRNASDGAGRRGVDFRCLGAKRHTGKAEKGNVNWKPHDTNEVIRLVDGELEEPHEDDRDGLWPFSPKAGSLDMRHRLPDRLVGLAASLRSMPTAS